MPAASRYGDLSTGHGCFPPTTIFNTSTSRTYINGKLAAARTAKLKRHCCGLVCHVPTGTRFVSGGSSNVFIEGKKAVRISDAIACGDRMGQGSKNVFIGG